MLTLRVASVMIAGAMMAPWASAQTTPATPAPAQTTPAPAAAPADGTKAEAPPARLHEPIPTDPAHPNYHEGAHKTIVRHNPLPRRRSYDSYYQGSSGSSGYSTGGVGRYGEYYDQSTLSNPVNNHPSVVAQYGNGGIPDRNEQIAAQQAGQVRARNIQDNINAYSRPSFGYGLGFGGGRMYSYPY